MKADPLIEALRFSAPALSGISYRATRSVPVVMRFEAAEAFANGDPFLSEGVVKEYQIKEWGDQMLS